MYLDLPIKLPDDEAFQKLDRMAKEHSDEDIRYLAEVAAGWGRCIVSLADSLRVVGQLAADGGKLK